jgi:hypothetical protein
VTRRPPRLVITLELECDRRGVWLDAETYEDELRLRSWLRRTAALATLSAFLEDVLDNLDRIDEDAA